MNILQFIITGPSNTPYSNGCFLFNLVIPPNYPEVPPLCQIVTTGNGLVRFNPNLYADGKVCLSLLGTWQGDKSEKWNSNTSTILQLLVSIQSLILVEDPFFNEPGYEKLMNTPQGIMKNNEYNDAIHLATMKWAILDQLKNPSNGFEDAIKIHFRLKKHLIIEECEKWTNNAQKHKDIYIKYYNEIITELEKIDNL
jgi:baculoviral IAP repeat-containing protein 6